MWMMVMFDLPVVTRDERAAAANFRLGLLDMGFTMCQFSVYLRFCTSNAQVETYCRRVERILPVGGRVSVLQFTDRQYERIVNFHQRSRLPEQKTPGQFHLF